MFHVCFLTIVIKYMTRSHLREGGFVGSGFKGAVHHGEDMVVEVSHSRHWEHETGLLHLGRS